MCFQAEDWVDDEFNIRSKCETSSERSERKKMLNKTLNPGDTKSCSNYYGNLLEGCDERHNLKQRNLFININSHTVSLDRNLESRVKFESDSNIHDDDKHSRRFNGSTVDVCCQNNAINLKCATTHDVNLPACDYWTTTKDLDSSRPSKCWKSNLSLYLRLILSLYMCLLSQMCLYFRCWKSKCGKNINAFSISRKSLFKSQKYSYSLLFVSCFATLWTQTAAYSNHFDKTDDLLEKVNLEQSIAAVFNKVAYGSTTKRSIPDNSYPITTLATPLLTTYRYSDGSDEWLRVDVKSSDNDDRISYDDDDNRSRGESSYGSDLEKDHGLPTSAPAADILKNNNNKNYNNPNRYNNDRLRPDFDRNREEQQVTENVYKTTSSYVSRNVRPTKSIYSKNVPSYVPPNRDFFTPPLPPQYINPFADKPTLRGTNSDSFENRRPLPPPSLMPNKDRIPFRPDLPPNKVNMEKSIPERPQITKNLTADSPSDSKTERKKTLNTPSQTYNSDRLGEYHITNRNLNETNFEYERGYIPTITRILSGSNGRHDDIPEILLKSVTATPHVQRSSRPKIPVSENVDRNTKMQDSRRNNQEEEDVRRQQNFYENNDNDDSAEDDSIKRDMPESKLPDKPEGVTSRKEVNDNNNYDETTISTSDVINLANVKGKESKESKVTKANSDEVWLICWNVHVYLVVFVYIILAIFSIYKLIRYEHDPHMFSKSYFLTVHLLLTIICVLRIFYLTYDPYNVGRSFDTFLYEFLHNFPLSLLGTTFAVLILFLLKRTLNHLKVKTRPIFLVVFGIFHILLCFCLSLVEALGYFDKASLIVCKPVFVLLAWALGFSYLYLYKIIKNVLAKKTQNLSEICTQNISYASHITIAVALLFILLGFVQLYSLFFIKVDRFNNEIKHHWILWGFELSVRVLEIAIVTLLAIVVSLKMSQREKQTVGFPLFPCTTSDSSADNIFPNNCTTNPNAANYTRNEMIMDNMPTETIERPNLLKHVFQNDSFDKKSTLERYRQPESDNPNFDRFERPKWGSERFEVDRLRQNVEQTSLNSFGQPNSGSFERGGQNSLRIDRTSGKKTYDSAKYYAKPRYDLEYNDEDEFGQKDANVYSEPIDNHQYERTRTEFERSNFDRRSKNSTNTSGRRSTGRSRKNHARPHLGVQTLPGQHEIRHQQVSDTMLVDDQGFVRFRHLQDFEPHEKPSKKKYNNEVNHYSDA